MRWPIVRNVLALVVIAAGAAVAGPLGKKKQPEPVEPDPVPAVEPTPAPPAAPALFPEPPPVALEEVPAGLANLTAQACNACHHQAHDDWKGSAHEVGWQGSTFQAALSATGGSTACRSCHLPLVNQHPKLAAGFIDGDIARPDLRPNALWDPSLMAEGVGCATCHVRQGVVLGTRAVADAPHPVAVSGELSSPEMCATCHQLTWPGVNRPIYDTYGEWKASPYAEAGVRCQDCHMPRKAGSAVGSRFAAQASHTFAADAARALSILVDLDSAEVQRGAPFPVRLRLQNTGAGHHFPTGSPFKLYRVQVELVAADGRPIADAWTHDLQRKVEQAPPWNTLDDNRIPAGGEVALDTELTVSQKKGSGPAYLVVSVHRVVGKTAGPALVEHRVPVEVL